MHATVTLGLTWDHEEWYDNGGTSGLLADVVDLDEFKANIEDWRDSWQIEGDREAAAAWEKFCAAVDAARR